jgi:hypothetical protein
MALCLPELCRVMVEIHVQFDKLVRGDLGLFGRNVGAQPQMNVTLYHSCWGLYFAALENDTANKSFRKTETKTL